MKKVARFEAKDGKEFKTEGACAQHEKTLLFREWYCQRHGLPGTTLTASTVQEWLQKYSLQVLELLDVSNGKA